MGKIILSLFTLTLAVSTYGFEREYVKRAVLTKEQEKTVIELAKKAGIKKVAKISSHDMFPSPYRACACRALNKSRAVKCPIRF